VSFVKRQEDPRDYKVDFSKVHRVLGYEVTKRVPDGIAEVMQGLDEDRFPDPFGKAYRNIP